MNWTIPAVTLAVSALCAVLWVWMTQRERVKNAVSVPFGEDFGLIAYREGAARPRIVLRREGFFGTRVGGEWMGLIVASQEEPDHYEVYWSPTKLVYQTEGDRKHLKPTEWGHHAVCADIDEALEEVVGAEQNHVRNLNRLHEAQRRLRGHS